MSLVRVGLFALIGVHLAACSTLERLPAVPQAHADDVDLLGQPNIRFRIPGDIEEFAAESVRAQQRERDATGNKGALPSADFLAISGGGDSGAFGAGLLVGWTEHGSRPAFKIVTGVSTGALAAPYAFLGPEYDAELEAVYTRVGPEDIYRERLISGGLFGDAAADNAPMRNLIADHIDDRILQAIADEYAKGRLLYIVTTDLDSLTPVIWNMGAIAASKSPAALGLFRDIMVASAAIPGIFPPIMMTTKIQGNLYQEMHVDGGVSTQILLYPPSARNFAREIAPRERRLYIIRNAKLSADTVSTDRSTLAILQRAISGLIRSQGIGDLYRIYTTAQRDGIAYNLAHIEEEFAIKKPGDFDTEFMSALFKYGRTRAREGYRWRDVPPGMDPPPATISPD